MVKICYNLFLVRNILQFSKTEKKSLKRYIVFIFFSNTQIWKTDNTLYIKSPTILHWVSENNGPIYHGRSLLLLCLIISWTFAYTTLSYTLNGTIRIKLFFSLLVNLHTLVSCCADVLVGNVIIKISISNMTLLFYFPTRAVQ